jgi:hypothetical protein
VSDDEIDCGSLADGCDRTNAYIDDPVAFFEILLVAKAKQYVSCSWPPQNLWTLGEPGESYAGRSNSHGP